AGGLGDGPRQGFTAEADEDAEQGGEPRARGQTRGQRRSHTPARRKAQATPSRGMRVAIASPMRWFEGYNATTLRQDLMAALVVTAIIVPEGMAYARLAGLKPEAVF